MYGFVDKSGNKIDDVLEWGRLFGDKEYSRIATDTLPDGTMVSTMWIGIVMPMQIFETAVFDAKGVLGDMYRYETLKEAEEGHKKVVMDIKNNG